MWSFYPIAPLVLLMVIVWWLTAFRRIRGSVAGEVRIESIIYGNQHELPKPLILPGRSYDNLMQQPVMFMVLMLMIFQLQMVHVVMMGLAWLFAITRVWHAFEHLRAKNVRRRTLAFAISSVCHWALWVWVFVGIANPS